MTDTNQSGQASDKSAAPQPFPFLGNQLWLDFLNTQIVQNGERLDLLVDFADFLRWLIEARALDEANAHEALRRWASTAEQGEILEQVRSFRAVLRTAAGNVTRAQPVADDAVSAINDVLQHHFRSLLLVPDGGKLTRQFVGEITEPIHLLAPIAESAAQALSDPNLSLTRKCENPLCVLHFHDTTKNHRRRWCQMETCGNRIKAAAHYRRTKMPG